MTNPELDRLESAIDQLSFTEQLWLMDRLAQRIRDRLPRLAGVRDQELEAMAQDPAIQREMLEIENEFAIDGTRWIGNPSMNIQRGEIYFVNLNPVQGREQAGQRPVLVLSIDLINNLPLVVTVVVGTRGEKVPRDYPTNVPRSVRGKRVADGNRVPLFPDPLPRPSPVSRRTCRKTRRENHEPSRKRSSVLPGSLVSFSSRFARLTWLLSASRDTILIPAIGDHSSISSSDRNTPRTRSATPSPPRSDHWPKTSTVRRGVRKLRIAAALATSSAKNSTSWPRDDMFAERLRHRRIIQIGILLAHRLKGHIGRHTRGPAATGRSSRAQRQRRRDAAGRRSSRHLRRWLRPSSPRDTRSEHRDLRRLRFSPAVSSRSRAARRRSAALMTNRRERRTSRRTRVIHCPVRLIVASALRLANPGPGRAPQFDASRAAACRHTARSGSAWTIPTRLGTVILPHGCRA